MHSIFTVKEEGQSPGTTIHRPSIMPGDGPPSSTVTVLSRAKMEKGRKITSAKLLIRVNFKDIYFQQEITSDAIGFMGILFAHFHYVAT